MRCVQGGPYFQIDVPKVGLIFEFQTRGLETWMASIPRTSVLFLFVFFRSLAQPIAVHTQKRKYRKSCAEMNNFLCFIFVFEWSNSGWPQSELLILAFATYPNGGGGGGG